MPIFKTTKNILVDPWNDELFDSRFTDTDKAFYPPNKPWDNSRELQIDDIDIWEVLYEGGGGTGVYAAWDPYAEFYMLRVSGYIETYYGPRAQEALRKELDRYQIPYSVNKLWVSNEEMHLYKNQ